MWSSLRVRFDHSQRNVIKRVTVVLPDSLHKDLKLRSVQTDIYMGQIIVDAVKMYLQLPINEEKLQK